MSHTPILAITIGDPNGIGPEIIIKALAKPEVLADCRAVVIGPPSILAAHIKQTGGGPALNEVSDPEEVQGGEMGVINPGLDENLNLNLGKLTALGGLVAGKSLEKAVQLARTGRIQAIVTAPISKSALNLAGYHYPGQTEFFADHFEVEEVVMVMLSGDFRVALATTHCAVAKVSQLLNRAMLVTKLQILNKALKEKFKIAKPKIAVAALNPHAGEGGMFGSEEKEIIAPAISEAQAQGIQADGPFPADTLFARFETKNYHAYFVMYHDQGLIPLKMKAFGKGVNFTAGLPIVRTSPDHGTAYDIAVKGVANSGSMEEAIKLAVQLVSKS